MRIIDVSEPSKIDRKPDQIIQLIQNASLVQDGFKIQRIEMRLYNQHTDDTLGIFSIITAFVETDKGSIEILYDEGYRGHKALDDTVKFLTQNLGLSSLILRCIISLKNNR